MSPTLVETSIVLRCVNRVSREFERASRYAEQTASCFAKMPSGLGGFSLRVASRGLTEALTVITRVTAAIPMIYGLISAIHILISAEIFLTFATWVFNVSFVGTIYSMVGSFFGMIGGVGAIATGVGLIAAVYMMIRTMEALAQQREIKRQWSHRVAEVEHSMAPYGIKKRDIMTRGMEG